jgi:hypothetical protein
MKKLDFQRFIDRLPFDISAEALMAILLEDREAGWELDQLVVRPKGKKGFLKDVHQVEERHYGKEEILYLDVSRDGLFDALPALLFLDEEKAKGRNDEPPLTYTEQVAEARKFFLPFDQAIFLARAVVAQWEHRAIKSPAETLQRFWKLPPVWKTLREEQKTAIIFLLPLIPQIVGDIEMTVLCLKAILGKNEVNIQRNAPAAHPIAEKSLIPLGEAGLGEDFVVGSSYYDGIIWWEIQLSAIPPSEVEDFLYKGRTLALFEEILFPYFTPLDVDVSLDVSALRSPEDFSLSSDSFTSILGYTTNL